MGIVGTMYPEPRKSYLTGANKNKANRNTYGAIYINGYSQNISLYDKEKKLFPILSNIRAKLFGIDW